MYSTALVALLSQPIGPSHKINHLHHVLLPHIQDKDRHLDSLSSRLLEAQGNSARSSEGSSPVRHRSAAAHGPDSSARSGSPERRVAVAEQQWLMSSKEVEYLKGWVARHCCSLRYAGVSHHATASSVGCEPEPASAAWQRMFCCRPPPTTLLDCCRRLLRSVQQDLQQLQALDADLHRALVPAGPDTGLGQHIAAMDISRLDMRDVPSHSSVLVERLSSSIGKLLEQQLQVS
jgi:hypothetical protein